jgi:arylsulfatase A-like enzyme
MRFPPAGFIRDGVDMQQSAPARPHRSFAGRATTPLIASLLALAVASPASADSTRVVQRDVRADSAIVRTPLERRSAHVVIISIDGLRPDAIEKFGARTLQRLMREGSYTLQAQTISPSKTLPSHTSMLTGVDVDRHGISWNSDKTDEHGHVDVPTVFGLATAQGLHTAAFFSKTKFNHLEAPNTIDYVRAPKGRFFNRQWLAARTTALVAEYLADGARSPDLMFVHFGEPDFAGHVYGWMSGTYGQAVREADAAVADVLARAEQRFGRGNFTVIVTADHGGHGRSHGSDDPRDTTIPWITWGKGVVPGAPVAAGVKTMDTAATALWLLGIEAPGDWVGRAVASAFVGGATVVTAPGADSRR